MRRREFLGGSAQIGVLGIAGCLGSGTDQSFSDGFEQGIDEWETGAAIGPEVDLPDFEWEVGVSDEQAAEGSRSLRIWNEGTYDDGVTWAVHPVSVTPDRAYEIEMSAQLWSESESFNTLRDVVMRLGPDPPSAEEDFPQPGVNTSTLGETPYGGLREPLWLEAGWREYAFEWTTPTISTDTLHVAIGTAVIWEGDATHYVDEVSVEIDSQ